MNDSDDLIILCAGWFLGILSTPIVNFINDFKDRRNLIVGISSELHDIQARTLAQTFNVAINLNEFDEEFVSWFDKNLKFLSGTKIDSELGLNKTYGIIINQIIGNKNLINQYCINLQSNKSLNIVPIEIPYAESKMSNIPLLTATQQTKFFSVRRKISFINANIKKIEEWNRMSFEVTSTENHEGCVANERSCMSSILLHSKSLVDSIRSYLNEPGLY